MKLLQTTNEELARDFESFLERRHPQIKPFLQKELITFQNAQYVSYSVGYENIKSDKPIPPYMEKAVFKEDEVKLMLYESGYCDY